MAYDQRSNLWNVNAYSPYQSGAYQYGYQKVAPQSQNGSSVHYVNKPVRYVSNQNSAPSAVETAIIHSNRPINVGGSKVVTVNGQTGVLVNEDELARWRGPPLNEYHINSDPNPQVITKKPADSVNYIQDVNVRYLKPPTPTPPGEIVITQEPSKVVPPAPPVVIRQQPPRPDTPPPVVIREAPPPPPPPVPRQYLNIPGKIIPPPPRKVIIERLPPLPSKPQIVYIDRWLPYDQIRRRVIYRQLNDLRPQNYQEAVSMIRQQPGNFQQSAYPLGQPPLGQPVVVNVQEQNSQQQQQQQPQQNYYSQPDIIPDPNYQAVVPYQQQQQQQNQYGPPPPQQYGPPPSQQQYAPPSQQFSNYQQNQQYSQQPPPPPQQQQQMNQYGAPVYQQ